MRIGSLFSGIGGLELGLEWSGLGHTVWQVERDVFCRGVLAKHWPRVERFEDVKTVGRNNLRPVDLICGGFPCQDVSSVGRRAGLGGANSGLWVEFLRIVTELRPGWVVVENVASGAAKWVDSVRTGLEQQGYACLPVPLAAADVGAKHRRARVFIIAAHTHAPIVRNEPRGSRWPRGQGPAIAPRDGRWAAEPTMGRVVHGISRGVDGASSRVAALGNAVVPQCAEVIGHIIQELERSYERKT